MMTMWYERSVRCKSKFCARCPPAAPARCPRQVELAQFFCSRQLRGYGLTWVLMVGGGAWCVSVCADGRVRCA